MSSRVGAIGVLLWVTLSGCGPAQWSEEEREFFEERSTPLKQWAPNTEFGIYPDQTGRAFLRTYKPRIYISPSSYGPVDFYESYLPQAELVDENSQVLQAYVSRLDLKRFERSPGVSLRLTPNNYFCRGRQCPDHKTTAYVRMEYDQADLGEERFLHFIVLTYQFVFPYRGLPRGLSRLQEWASQRLGDPERWVEFGQPATIQVLVPGNGGEPFLVLISHPSYFRTYVVGRDIDWDPEVGGLKICFASRSNQPYPCPVHEPKKWIPTAAKGSSAIDFLFGEGLRESGLSAFDEVVNEEGGAIPVPYELAYLPNQDPLKVAWMPLGNSSLLSKWRSRLMSMSRAGLDYFNPLSLRRPFDLALFFSFDPKDTIALRIVREQRASFSNSDFDFQTLVRWNGRNLLSTVLERNPIEAFQRTKPKAQP